MRSGRSWSARSATLAAGVVLVAVAVAATSRATAAADDASTRVAAAVADVPSSPPPPDLAQVLRGRVLLINHGCAGCHGGVANPASDRYLAGAASADDHFLIGPCATRPGATPCFRTYARNLTPDNATGIGRFSERQIFNALRYGLRPGETPDVEITSMTPGEGNFPANPKYLAPPMPWPEWRHMSDQELWDIAAYLKHGVQPARNRVPDSEGPPDFWASDYTPEKIGPYPLPPFPTVRERMPQ